MTEPKLAQEPKVDLGVKAGQDTKEPGRENPKYLWRSGEMVEWDKATVHISQLGLDGDILGVRRDPGLLEQRPAGALRLSLGRPLEAPVPIHEDYEDDLSLPQRRVKRGDYWPLEGE